jgi:hypothetical protein
MRTRLISAIILAIIAIPVLVLGLIDPLEGGIALLVAVALVVVARLLSRVPVPKLTWIPMAAAIAIGALVLSLVIFANPSAQGDGSVPSPANATVIALLWTYRVAVLVSIAGAVVHVVRLIRAVRMSPAPPRAVAAQ